MKPFPTAPLERHNLFIASLCADWSEAGRVTRKTPRVDAVRTIANALKQSAEDR